jgi:4-hydroxybenzoate polyprenyltransferase
MKAMPTLRFLRVSALPSAWADVLGACALIVGLSDTSMGEVATALPFLLVLSTCLYLYGMGLNDLMHVRKDAMLGKNRPIPSGELSSTQGIVVVFALITFATLISLLMVLFGAVAVGPVTFLLIMLIWLYNWLSSGKVHDGQLVPTPMRTALSVPVIALCRVLHVALPLLAFGAVGSTLVFFMASSFVYFSLVTTISLFEDRGGGQRELALIDLLLVPTVFAFPVFLMTRHVVGDKRQIMYWGALLTLLALLSQIHKALGKAVLSPTPPNVGRAVGTGIRGNCLFMGAIAIAAAPGQPYLGMACIALFFVGGWAGKYVSPT